MKTIQRTQVIYHFSPDNPPVTSVKPGDTVLVETDDCFGSQIRSEKDLVTAVDFSKVNPATGPIEVEGAVPGDLLSVQVLDIQVGKKGFMVAIPEEGGFGHVIKEPATKEILVSEGEFWFTRSLSFPTNPMIGVIGVSPADGAVPCGEIGDHGGNMDAKVICRGARVYFLVRQEGVCWPSEMFTPEWGMVKQ